MKWFLVSLIFLGIILAVPLNLKNDLDGNLFHLLFIKHELALGQWSNWNPYLHQGLPVMADPINFFWYPLAPLVLLLPVEISVRLIFAVSWILTAIFAYYLFRLTRLPKELAGWLAITYAGSSYFLARIAAGHLEKVLSYPLIPLFFLMLVSWWQKPNFKSSGLIAICFYLLLSSSDMYNFLYLAIGFGVFGIYLLFAKRQLFRTFLVSGGLAILFTAVRWLPMLTIFGRLFKIPEVYEGSQNLASLLLQMVFPKPSLFNQIVPTNFAWWEKTAFVGPIFIVILLLPKYWQKIKNNPATILASIFGLVSIEIAMPARLSSVWHWLVAFLPPLTMFHVPTRVLAVLSLCLILLTGPIIASFGKWGIRALRINLILLAAVWLFMINFRLPEKISKGYAKFIPDYPGSWSSVLYLSLADRLQERDWQIPWNLFFTTHGTYIAGSAAADWLALIVLEKPFLNWTPDYKVLPDQDHTIITLTKDTAGVGLSRQGKVTVGSDKLIVDLAQPASQEAEVVVYQSYLPGWLDSYSNNGYLAKKIFPGQTRVEFIYFPQEFYLGAAISLLSISIWAIKS